MFEPKFVHLRVHSDFSIVDGLAKTEALVKQAAFLGMPALAITDFTNLCGFIKFYKTSHSVGIKPIIGADFYVQNELFNYNLTKLTVLAINNAGYKNLTLLISKAYQRGYGSFGPWINHDWLIEYREGILLLSGGRIGDIGYNLLRGNSALVERYLDFYQKYFHNHFYIELIRTGRPDEENYLHLAISLAEKRNLPVVATNDVCFINRHDFNAHEVRVAIYHGFIFNDPKRPKNYSPEQYMRSEDEMCQLFSDVPEALKNSVEIAKRCNVTIRLGEYFLPQFPTGGMVIEDLLIKKSKNGLEERLRILFPDRKEYKKRHLEYNRRLDFELQVINKMGFPGYFLIVMEFIQWSKNNDIPVGPGRGSGAGSLVAYALNITDLNPLEFDLLFERFLNPERVSMPDFDIDFCMEKRDQVIGHVADTYGREAVSQIITFGTMAARAAIRDVGRVLGYPYGFVDRISKLVPSDPGMTLNKAFEVESKFSEIYQSDEEIKVLIDMARKLEGVIRNVGKHAGGVVISPTKITDFSPIYCDEAGKNPVTQFDKNDIESIGLVKFDFLGLRTLTVISNTIKMINERRRRKNEEFLKISAIPLNDQKSFRVLQNAETIAVFQLESNGMRDLIKRLQPDCFEDMIALMALFRPGPLQSGMVDNFINRKHGREEIFYPDRAWQHESLKSILEPTYGIILYQEQIMQIAQVFSGYTLGSADILRRAMGKKNPKEMAEQRAIFRTGAIKNGFDSTLALKLFDLVEKFAGYGFNKSHSAAYALISYQTLWLKTHYPAEFMAAVMTAEMDNTEKIVELIDECFRMGLKILPPNINFGQYHFHVNDDGEIVYGIGAIKGVGESSIEAIIEARKNGGAFRELFDLCERTDFKKLNRRVLEKLIMSGALDGLGLHRASLMNSLENALKFADQRAKAKKSIQTDMFDFFTEECGQIKKFVHCRPWTEQEILSGERETLGLYLTSHPINQYLKEIENYIGGVRIKDIFSINRDRSIITVVGLVVKTKIMLTKKRGKHIGFCTLDDRSGRLEVVFFSDILDKYQSLLEKDRVLVINGYISYDDFYKRFKMIAQSAMDINKVREKYTRGLSILLTEQEINNQLLNQLRQCLESYCPGTIPVHLYCKSKGVRTRLNFSVTWCVSFSDRLFKDLRALLSVEQVELEFD